MTRPYVDHPVTDLAAAERAAAIASSRWSLGKPTLIRNGMNAIFATGDVVLRVSEPSVDASASIDLAEMLLAIGLRVPRPSRDAIDIDGMAITCWERIVEVPEPVDWRAVGAMIRRVHSIAPADVPGGVPLPSGSTFAWWDFERLFAETVELIDEPALDGLQQAVRRWHGWPTGGDAVVCHGDVHPGNVMMSDDGPVLIDWDLLCLAPAGWDHGPMMTWHERWGGAAGEYDAFANGYGQSLRDDWYAQAFAELRLVAATLMRVKAGGSHPAARDQAEVRLRYWRGDPDAPMWTAQ